ncbi:MAG: phage holin family protein [Candidatus Binatia bacterium]
MTSEPTPSVASAAGNVIDKAQKVLLDRIQLLQLEAREDLVSAARGAACLILAALLLFYGWLFALALVVWMLWGTFSLAVSLAVVIAFHVVAGGLLAFSGLRILEKIRLLRPDDDSADRREQTALQSGLKGAA